ncbi:MAG: hypothetical protein K2Q10_11880, partial [Rhodospirillales bacterium]|nr:hypothetical protein [Rhodospirillales bacterium]
DDIFVLGAHGSGDPVEIVDFQSQGDDDMLALSVSGVPGLGAFESGQTPQLGQDFHHESDWADLAGAPDQPAVLVIGDNSGSSLATSEHPAGATSGNSYQVAVLDNAGPASVTAEDIKLVA